MLFLLSCCRNIFTILMYSLFNFNVALSRNHSIHSVVWLRASIDSYHSTCSVYLPAFMMLGITAQPLLHPYHLCCPRTAISTISCELSAFVNFRGFRALTIRWNSHFLSILRVRARVRVT